MSHRHCLAAAAALACAGPAWAAADPFVGASTSGRASHYTLICGTCPVDFVVDATLADGGAGQASSGVSTVSPGFVLQARAALDGPGGLPSLGAAASTEVLVDPSIPKTFFYKSGGTAQALQRFDYGGSTAQAYVIDFTLEGSTTLLGRDDAASLMQVLGGFTVYGADYDPFAEIRGTRLASQFLSERARFNGTHDFSLSGSLAFTVNPGDHFYVWGLLDATSDAGHDLAGGVDASHTLAAHFSAGDTSLLTASLLAPPVPEPPPAALLAAGLAALGWLRRAYAGRKPSIER